MKQQDSVIKARDVQIKELRAKIEFLKKGFTKTLIDIAKENSVAKNSSNSIDSISKNQLKKEKLKWKGLHLYTGIEVPEFNFQRSVLNSEFMYELEKIEFGLKGEVAVKINSKYTFNLFLKLRYKIF